MNTQKDEILHNVCNPLACIQALTWDSVNREKIEKNIKRIDVYLRNLDLEQRENKLQKIIEDQKNIIESLRNAQNKRLRRVKIKTLSCNDGSKGNARRTAIGA